MNAREVKKAYLQSTRLPPPTPIQMLGLGLTGLMLCPVYWLLARRCGVPGLEVRRKCFDFGLRLVLKRHGPIDFKTLSLLFFYPLDSTRYFELDFAWSALAASPVEGYLDVSSPRLLFALLLLQHKNLRAHLINPDTADLAETEALLRAGGLRERCHLHDCRIADAPFAPASFGIVTCISVLEHIPEDQRAMEKIWELLRPGGRLLLTVPCAAQTSEQYIDRDEYGLLGADTNGYAFWQRFYDAALLEERIFRVTGGPHRSRIFGERAAGLFLKNATRKRADRFYPFWREPYMVGQEYRYFDSLDELPGEGVMAMEFVKP